MQRLFLKANDQAYQKELSRQRFEQFCVEYNQTEVVEIIVLQSIDESSTSCMCNRTYSL